MIVQLNASHSVIARLDLAIRSHPISTEQVPFSYCIECRSRTVAVVVGSVARWSRPITTEGSTICSHNNNSEYSRYK